jgi:hypothetical protein
MLMLRTCILSSAVCKGKGSRGKAESFSVLFYYVVHDLCHASIITTDKQSPGVEEIQPSCNDTGSGGSSRVLCTGFQAAAAGCG